MRKILLFLLLIFFFIPSVVNAVECSISVSPSNSLQNTFENFVFRVNNLSGGDTYKWTRLSITAEDIDLNNPSADGWTTSGDRSQGIFSSAGGGIAPGQSQTYTFSDSGVGPGPISVSVSAEASLNEDGLGSGSCGTTTINIVTEFASIPVISNLAIAVGATSATVSWNTDISSTGVVNYGTTNSYGGSISTSEGTTHSATLPSLSSSTTYHYQIQNSSAGGSTSTADEVFTTAASGTTSTTTTTSTPATTTSTTSTTVTKTIILADTTAPVVQIDTKLEKPVATPPIISGKVIDSGAVNVGIAKIQYSIDEGKSWLLIDEPNGASRTSYSFVPEVYEDGNYSLRVRAIDRSGNIGISSTLLLIIDRLPPRIIHSLWHVGPLVINGDNNGKRKLVAGVPIQFVVQGVGGIIEIELSIGPNIFPLTKNKETGFWEGSILLTNGGEWDATIAAVDGGGSKTEQKIGRVDVDSTRAALPAKTEVEVWKFDKITGQFNQWNGRPYSQENPHEMKTNWFLPAGSYYFHLLAPGYNSAVSNIFFLTESRTVTIDTQLKKWNFWGLLGIVDEFKVVIPTELSDSTELSLIGKQLFWLENTEWEGKEFILSIIPTWDPSAASRFRALSQAARTNLETPYVVVIPGANSSSVELLKNRGQYSLNMVADPDGEILQDLQGTSFPLTMRVNRKGITEEVLGF